MNTLMLEQIYRNLDGRAYDSDDLEYTGEQLIDRAMTQAVDYYDVTKPSLPPPRNWRDAQRAGRG